MSGCPSIFFLVGRWGVAKMPVKKSWGGAPPLGDKLPLRDVAVQLVAWINPEGCPLADQLL